MSRQFQDQAEREWLTWRQVCKQLEKLGVVPNDQTPLMTAIKLWGEELHLLLGEVAQQEGGEEIVYAARAKLREKYVPVGDWGP